MVDHDVSNIFFKTFSIWYFLDPVFRANLSKIGQITGLVIVPKRKNKKFKMLLMLLFDMCDAPQKISVIFCPFLTIFTLFHLRFLQLCKNFPISYFRDPLNLDRLGK